MNNKKIVLKILNIVLWIVLFAWIAICLFDFYNVKQLKNPKFCISKKVNKYDDGVTESCLGLGYKVYNYKKDGYNKIEFGPFWIKEKK